MLFGLVGPSWGTLADSARLALIAARRERLPLAVVAQRNAPDAPQYWFATSILSVVAVQGRPPRESHAQTLTKDLRDGFTLSADMTALLAAGEDEPRFVDLRLTKKEFKHYLKWARSVQ